jgi:alkylation response protein AidB-like acyl-CoA dehydrogenase
MVGGMERVLESAVDYATGRFQFGRAIGSFQAIKHRCADMLIAFEGARTAVAAALSAAAADDTQRAVLTSVAKAHCGRAYDRIAVGNMQIQGGVGYTWEYDAHLYYRRARSCDVLLGDASLHHEKLAWLLAEGAA